MAEPRTPRDRIEAATVAMIHECRRLKCPPGKVGSAGQWGLIAKAGIDAADAFSALASADSPSLPERTRDDDLDAIGTPIGLGGRRVKAGPGVDMSGPNDHGLIRRLP